MVSKNANMVSLKARGGELMTVAMQEDIREVAMKFDEVFRISPEDYYYLKGFIHCLLQKTASNIPDTHQEAAQ